MLLPQGTAHEASEGEVAMRGLWPNVLRDIGESPAGGRVRGARKHSRQRIYISVGTPTTDTCILPRM